jgi:1-phosphatidylinositol-4-phosphate 5-kinase
LAQYGAIKRLEHFWKSLSNVESQLSPIPPDRYGDRFVRFISGITKTPEAAEKDQAERSMENDGTTGQHPKLVRSPTDKVMDRAERQADRSSHDLMISDNEAPNRALSTARSPSAERGDPGGFTLPVVEEAAESQSTGGRSENPSPSPPTLQSRGRSEEIDRERQRPPPTPPKDGDQHSVRSHRMTEKRLTPPILHDSKTASGDGPPTPPSEKDKRRRTRIDVDKELPPPPPREVIA